MTDIDKRIGWNRATEWNHAHPPGSPVLAWPGARDQEPLETRTRSGAWVLGSGEPVVSVVGHTGGIHLDHIEHDPTRQPALPDVEFELPPCPVCGKDLECDGDALVCHPCSASWDAGGCNGQWLSPDAQRCPAEWQPLPDHKPELIERCVLAAGHDLGDGHSKHRPADGFGEWTDSDPKAFIDGSGEFVR